MKEYYRKVIAKYKKKGIIVDSNLLLLFFVGLIDIQLIKRFSRTIKYSDEDFGALLRILSNFEKIITSPQILTETNNLANKLVDEHKKRFYFHFSQKIQDFSEFYLPSVNLSNTQGFERFGLTDISILEVARNEFLVLTEDFRLSQFLIHNNIDVININNLRDYYLFI